jgi:hypothetical protein
MAVMRFHTTHLLGVVVIAALVFGIMRHPESLFAVLVPLAGGICVVLPVLGTLELLTPREAGAGRSPAMSPGYCGMEPCTEVDGRAE